MSTPPYKSFSATKSARTLNTSEPIKEPQTHRTRNIENCFADFDWNGVRFRHSFPLLYLNIQH